MEIHAIEKEYFEDLSEKTRKNAQIAGFYDGLFFDTGDFAFQERARAVAVCCKWWDMDYYRLQAVKDIKRVNLCRDKFCYNCQSLLAIKRQNKYAPMLDKLYKDYTLCHVVVTVPNVPYLPQEGLKSTIKKMYLRFKHLTRFLSGDKKVRNVNFTQYGYSGAVRALEVTTNAENTFHPHFHCIMLLRKGYKPERKYTNAYSYDHGQLTRKFSDLEILLQKVWYLLMNDIPVTRESIEGLKEGYSVIVDEVPKGEYHEVFKYACKGAFKDGTIYDRVVFRALFYALHGRRMIQGYGVLHNFKDEDGAILEADLTENYEAMIAQLQYLEDPIFVCEHLEQLIEQNYCRYISKSNLRKLLIQQRREERGE